MDSDRFYHEVDREAQELDDINAELQYIGQENIEAKIDVQYSEFLQEMFDAIAADAEYSNEDYASEWDEPSYTVTGCDPAEYNDGWYDEQFEFETL